MVGLLQEGLTQKRGKIKQVGWIKGRKVSFQPSWRKE